MHVFFNIICKLDIDLDNESTNPQTSTNSHDLLPNGKPWTVTDYGEGERALTSLHNNRRPSHMMVVSCHTNPILQLPELLTRLAAYNLSNICCMPMNEFWKPAGQTDEAIGRIIRDFG